MARVLIVGCGCRGRSLARELVSRGHAVRGTTRREDGLEPIAAAGAEAVVADPDRLGTLLPHIEGVSALCWLMGTATGEVNGSRLRSMLEALVDTHVRGAVYEASAGPEGAEIALAAGVTYRMPVALVTEPPEPHDVWLEDALAAVDSVLAA